MDSGHGGRKLAFAAGFLHLSQILLVLLAPHHPEGFRKCFRKGGSPSSSYFRGSCRVGKAYSGPMQAFQSRNHRPISQRSGDFPMAPPRIRVDRTEALWMALTWPLSDGGHPAPSRFSPSQAPDHSRNRFLPRGNSQAG